MFTITHPLRFLASQPPRTSRHKEKLYVAETHIAFKTDLYARKRKEYTLRFFSIKPSGVWNARLSPHVQVRFTCSSQNRLYLYLSTYVYRYSAIKGSRCCSYSVVVVSGGGPKSLSRRHLSSTLLGSRFVARMYRYCENWQWTSPAITIRPSSSNNRPLGPSKSTNYCWAVALRVATSLRR